VITAMINQAIQQITKLYILNVHVFYFMTLWSKMFADVRTEISILNLVFD
jgi:hypothetical protein